MSLDDQESNQELLNRFFPPQLTVVDDSSSFLFQDVSYTQYLSLPLREQHAAFESLCHFLQCNLIKACDGTDIKRNLRLSLLFHEPKVQVTADSIKESLAKVQKGQIAKCYILLRKDSSFEGAAQNFVKVVCITKGKDKKLKNSVVSLQKTIAENDKAKFTVSFIESAWHFSNYAIGLQCECWPDFCCNIFNRVHPSGWPSDQQLEELKKVSLLLLQSKTADEDEFSINFSLASSCLFLKLPSSIKHAYFASSALLTHLFHKTALAQIDLLPVMFWLLEENSELNLFSMSSFDITKLFLKKLKTCLKKKTLYCFFLPQKNLLASLEQSELQRLHKAIGTLLKRFGDCLVEFAPKLQLDECRAPIDTYLRCLAIRQKYAKEENPTLSQQIPAIESLVLKQPLELTVVAEAVNLLIFANDKLKAATILSHLVHNSDVTLWVETMPQKLIHFKLEDISTLPEKLRESAVHVGIDVIIPCASFLCYLALYELKVETDRRTRDFFSTFLAQSSSFSRCVLELKRKNIPASQFYRLESFKCMMRGFSFRGLTEPIKAAGEFQVAIELDRENELAVTNIKLEAAAAGNVHGLLQQLGLQRSEASLGTLQQQLEELRSQLAGQESRVPSVDISEVQQACQQGPDRVHKLKELFEKLSEKKQLFPSVPLKWDNSEAASKMLDDVSSALKGVMKNPGALKAGCGLVCKVLGLARAHIGQKSLVSCVEVICDALEHEDNELTVLGFYTIRSINLDQLSHYEKRTSHRRIARSLGLALKRHVCGERLAEEALSIVLHFTVELCSPHDEGKTAYLEEEVIKWSTCLLRDCLADLDEQFVDYFWHHLKRSAEKHIGVCNEIISSGGVEAAELSFKKYPDSHHLLLQLCGCLFRVSEAPTARFKVLTSLPVMDSLRVCVEQRQHDRLSLQSGLALAVLLSESTWPEATQHIRKQVESVVESALTFWDTVSSDVPSLDSLTQLVFIPHSSACNLVGMWCLGKLPSQMHRTMFWKALARDKRMLVRLDVLRNDNEQKDEVRRRATALLTSLAKEIKNPDGN